MRIAYIVGSFPHVSETFIVNQIAGMAARGHEVDVFTTVASTNGEIPARVRRFGLTRRTYFLFGSPNYLLRFLAVAWLLLRYGWCAPGVVFRSLNVSRYGTTAASLGLLAAGLTVCGKRGGQYDIVHCQFGTYGQLALKLMDIGALSGALVVSFRGFDATRALRVDARCYDEVFRRADLVLPVSQALAKRLVAAGCDHAKIQVLHSGIELSQFISKMTNRSSSEATRVVAVARLTEKKGMEYAIRAAAHVVATGRKLTLDIVGDGPLRGALERVIRDLHMDDHVRLLGWRSHEQVISMLGRAHVLVAPSVTAAGGDEEGIPNAAKEAMALGIPVVGTQHGGIPELVEEGVSGFLVPERDDKALAERLVHLVDHPEIRAGMGRAGLARVVAEFDIHRLNDELASLYEELSSRSHAPPVEPSMDVARRRSV